MKLFLFFLAFLTYGVGDAISASWTMNKIGAQSQINPIVKYLFINFGALSIVAFKICITLFILFLVYIISLRAASYWATACFLISLSIGGILATIANIAAAYGFAFLSANAMVLLFLSLTVVLVFIGDFYDKKTIESWERSKFKKEEL